MIVAEKFRQIFYLNSFFGTLLYLALGITGLPDYIPLQAKDLSWYKQQLKRFEKFLLILGPVTSQSELEFTLVHLTQ